MGRHFYTLFVSVLTGWLVLICTTYNSQAQTRNAIDSLQDLSLEDIINLQVDVASAQKKKLISTASSVSIIDKNDIELYGFSSLAEALETVAGISIYRTYFKRDLPTARGILQDNYSNKMLILINKTPLWNAVTGEGNLSRIAINDIERIEILKGPASVVYGTNAYTGVINIVLKSSDKQHTSLQSSAGNHELRSIGANYATTQGDFSFFFAANSTSSNGSPIIFTGENGTTHTVNEFVNTNNYTLHTTYKNFSALLNTFKSEESFLGVVPSFESGAGHQHDVKGSALSLQGEKTFNKTTIKLNYTLDWQNRSMPRTQDQDIAADISGYKNSASINLFQSLSKHIHVEVEAISLFRHSLWYQNYNVYTKEKADEYAYGITFDGDNNMKNVKQWENSYMLQFHYSKNRFSSDIGGRYTTNKSFGNNISGRASFIYELATKQSVKFLYGESYRSPSIFETNFIYPAVLGNTGLKPETSRSAEIAYMGSIRKFFAHIICYHSWYNNRIYRKKEFDFQFENATIEKINAYNNGANVQSKGIEAEIAYKNKDFVSYFLNSNYILGSDANEKSEYGGNNFYYISPLSVSAGFSVPISIVHVSAVSHYYSKSNGPFYSIDEQYSFDASCNIKHLVFGKTVKHTIFVKNILNEQRILPEYVRKENINSVPNGYGRSFGYSLSLSL